MNNRLYYGDNLDILREHIADSSVDLIYLDPPFNSKRDYNLLFKTPKGQESDAQITAFEDTWHWGREAEREFHDIVKGHNTDVAEMMQALRKFLGENDMMAYLTMMANRLLEMHRVMKPTGALYLHCDPTVSHYLKIVLDGVFGFAGFRNEIVWRRTSSHGNVSRGYGDVTDSILYYTKSDKFTWNQVYVPYTAEHISKKFTLEPRDLDSARDLAVRDPHQFQLWACTLVGARPYKGGKRGSDRGIDGLLFAEVGGKTEKIVVSVKGGENIGAAMVRDLKGTLEREKAAIGLFVTLAAPTREMVKEAASAGLYEPPRKFGSKTFPKIQILTIQGLLEGRERAEYPDLAYGGATFRKAGIEEKREDQRALF